MAVELKVPSLGESITEVMIGTWYKKEGDLVGRDEPVVEIETDKTTVDLPAPAPGVVARILKKKGEIAQVGEVVGYLEEKGALASARPAAEVPAEPAASAPPATKAPAPETAPPKGAPSAPPAAAPAADQGARPAAGDDARVMPAARRLMAEHGLSAADVTASGPGGRILKEDVQRHVAGAKPAPATAPAAAVPASPAVSAHAVASALEEGRLEEVVPMTLIRRRIAERLVMSQQSSALLTTFNEIDMSTLLALRARHQPAFQERYGIKLGLISFFVKAAIDALKLVPEVNAEIRGTDIVYKNYYDIGVAVGGGRGLVVPVIRGADRLSFAEVELTLADLAQRAKNNTLQVEELQGGTFTISNGGIYGSLLATPIVNPPQTGILGMHAIKDRAVVVDGQVVARPMMYVALTYDHRIIDGREAVTFLKRVKECVEDPARILLEV